MGSSTDFFDPFFNLQTTAFPSFELQTTDFPLFNLETTPSNFNDPSTLENDFSNSLSSNENQFINSNFLTPNLNPILSTIPQTQTSRTPRFDLSSLPNFLSSPLTPLPTLATSTGLTSSRTVFNETKSSSVGKVSFRMGNKE